MSFAQADAGIGIYGAERSVARLDLQQLAGFLEGTRVLVALRQDVGIVVTCRVIIRCEYEHALEQEFGVIKRFLLDPDLRQQAHRFDVFAVVTQKPTHQLLGGAEFSLGKHIGRVDDLARQAEEFRHLSGSRLRLCFPAERVPQCAKRLPARSECVIATDRLLIGGYRRTRVTERAVAMPALLEKSAIVRVDLFQLLQRRERINDASEVGWHTAIRYRTSRFSGTSARRICAAPSAGTN